MRRFCIIVLFLALAHYATCSLITDRVTKDIPILDAEIEENNVVVPLVVPAVPEAVVPVEGMAAPNSVTETVECAKVGGFCINHKDCCSNACLGFKRRCVSGRELTEE